MMIHNTTIVAPTVLYFKTVEVDSHSSMLALLMFGRRQQQLLRLVEY